jgi:hypothetical protein
VLVATLRLLAVAVLSTAVVVAVLADESGVTAQDYDETFFSVDAETFDSDYDGYDDSVSLEMDVDTDGDYVDVTVDGELWDPYGAVVDSDSAYWTIYDAESEYGYLQLTNSWGDPGEYSYDLYLYDDLFGFSPEDSDSGSVYLYPVGYGDAPIVTRTPTPTPTPTFGPGPGPDNGGFNWYMLVGIGIGGLLIAAGVMQRNRRIQRGKVAGARIGELRAQMEKWRREGYDVSDLEDLFK